MLVRTGTTPVPSCSRFTTGLLICFFWGILKIMTSGRKGRGKKTCERHRAQIVAGAERPDGSNHPTTEMRCLSLNGRLFTNWRPQTTLINHRPPGLVKKEENGACKPNVCNTPGPTSTPKDGWRQPPQIHLESTEYSVFLLLWYSTIPRSSNFGRTVFKPFPSKACTPCKMSKRAIPYSQQKLRDYG